MHGKKKSKIELIDLFLIFFLLFLITFILCKKGLEKDIKEPEKDTTVIVSRRDMPLDYNVSNATIKITIKDGTKKYSSKKWYQELNIVFESSYTVKSLQWNKDGKWQEVCSESSYCEATIIEDMNDEVKFRTINYNDKVSYTTEDSYLIKIDNTLPTCNLDTTYQATKAIVKVNAKDSASGIYGISFQGEDYEEVEEKNYSITTNGTYSFTVKDNAGNEEVCVTEITDISESNNNDNNSDTNIVVEVPKMTTTKNGGTYEVAAGSKITLSFKVDFTNDSNVKEKYYGWSNSEGTKPNNWKVITKTNYAFSFESGSYYFWTKVITNDNNTYFYRTKEFKINEKSVDTKYLVYYNSNGGTTHSPKYVTNGSTYGSLITPYKTGYNFLGWYTENGTKVTSNTKVDLTSNIILYAKWESLEAKKFLVYYNSNGGTTHSPKYVTNGSTYGNLITPYKTGYNFLGWYTENGTKVTSNTKVDLTSNITLYAKWEEKENIKVTKLYSPTESNPIIICAEDSENCKSYLKGGNAGYAKKYAHMEIYSISYMESEETLNFTIKYKIYSGQYGAYSKIAKTQMYLGSYKKEKMISNNLYILRNGQNWGTGVEGVNTLVSSSTVTLKISKDDLETADYINTIVYTTNSNGYTKNFSFVSPYLFKVTK